MKRTLWVASSVAVLALPIGALTSRGIAGDRTADLGSLQQAISSKSVVDLTATQRAQCFKDCKISKGCSTSFQCKPCKC